MSQTKEEVADKVPFCPSCGDNKKVVKNIEQHAAFQLFVAKPSDTYFCTECQKGFN